MFVTQDFPERPLVISSTEQQDFCLHRQLHPPSSQDNTSKSHYLALDNSRQSSPLMLFTRALYQNDILKINYI